MQYRVGEDDLRPELRRVRQRRHRPEARRARGEHPEGGGLRYVLLMYLLCVHN